ncbi:hypothetical protein EYF80_019309 [Liparis tanakae]|uniref:Uncharacterized protein n=1 Tax=Liparis tanakae TaxID=230148 RepID=A0A4Z2HZP1_9TELE|nr:hypothetical protein EYF80_019309 [Liparis tanakae]
MTAAVCLHRDFRDGRHPETRRLGVERLIRGLSVQSPSLGRGAARAMAAAHRRNSKILDHFEELVGNKFNMVYTQKSDGFADIHLFSCA